MIPIDCTHGWLKIYGEKVSNLKKKAPIKSLRGSKIVIFSLTGGPSRFKMATP